MRSLMFFIWSIMGLWAFWCGDTTLGIACIVLAEANTIMLKLERIEQAAHSLVRYHIARAKADGYGRDEAPLEADNADHA